MHVERLQSSLSGDRHGCVAAGMGALVWSRCKGEALCWTLPRFSADSQLEELGYEYRLCELLGLHCNASFVSVCTPCLELVKLTATLDALWFIEGHEYRAPDSDVECRHCVAPIMHAVVGWHKMEVFVLPRARQHKH